MSGESFIYIFFVEGLFHLSIYSVIFDQLLIEFAHLVDLFFLILAILTNDLQSYSEPLRLPGLLPLQYFAD